MIALCLILAPWMPAPQGADPERVREDLGRILRRPEFREKMPTDFWKRLREYLKLKSAPEWEPPTTSRRPWCSSGTGAGNLSGSIMTVLFVVGISVVAAILIALVYRLWALRAPPPAPAAAGPPPEGAALNPLSRDSRDWARHAEELYRQGKFAEAVRALYLSVLSLAHLRNWIEYHPSRTNWEYVHRFAGPEAGRTGLGAITRTFEVLWFGRRPCAEADYLESRRHASALLDFREGPA